MANLTVRLTNNQRGTSGLGVQVSTLFGTDRLYHGMGDDTMNGIALIDAAHNKKYPVATDAQGNCVCDTNLNSTFVVGGQSVTLSASFAAPPPDVSGVDVLVPRFGTFHAIPISG